MNKNRDIRWIQRFDNYCKALAHLTVFIEKGELNALEEQGLIKAFEYCFELSWKALKDLLEYRGITGLIGSRDAFREAFKHGLLGDEQSATTWMNMLKSRNLTSHTYDETIMQSVVIEIRDHYFDCFVELRDCLQRLMNHERH